MDKNYVSIKNLPLPKAQQWIKSPSNTYSLNNTFPLKRAIYELSNPIERSHEPVPPTKRRLINTFHLHKETANPKSRPMVSSQKDKMTSLDVR